MTARDSIAEDFSDMFAIGYTVEQAVKVMRDDASVDQDALDSYIAEMEAEEV
ncbi:hypothetical protein [Cohnella sp. 56]|uniref:hypothetical protein n=1 Tax=Cohnella sp. 56 TaxID=3113722 RepID=UPI0030E7BE8D